MNCKLALKVRFWLRLCLTRAVLLTRRVLSVMSVRRIKNRTLRWWCLLSSRGWSADPSNTLILEGYWLGDTVMECTGTRFRKHGFEFPCGQCFVCRLRMQRTWVARILLEQAVHKDSCFVTLTYDPEHYPGSFVRGGVEYPAGSVNPRDVQLWLKRLRKAAQVPIRYVLVGEYGEKGWRPHYHVALFGSGSSELVLRSWGLGQVLVKGIGPESAAYIVSYVLKRRNNEERCEGRYPEFKLQSLRPAIGLRTSERLRIPSGSEVQGVRIANRIYPLGRYLRSKLRVQSGNDSDDATALRHRLAKYALMVRDPVDHERKVENAKTFTSSVLSKRREKQGL